MISFRTLGAPLESDDPFIAPGVRSPLGASSFFVNVSKNASATKVVTRGMSPGSYFPTVLHTPDTNSPTSRPTRSLILRSSDFVPESSSSHDGVFKHPELSPYSPTRPPMTPKSPYFSKVVDAEVDTDATMVDAFATPPPVGRSNCAISVSIPDTVMGFGLPSPPPSSRTSDKSKLNLSSTELTSSQQQAHSTPRIQPACLPSSVPERATLLTPPPTPSGPLNLQEQQQFSLPSAPLVGGAAPAAALSAAAPVKLSPSAAALQNYTLHPLFAAQYTLQEELGAGGFGFVVRAMRKCDEYSVAVKFIERAKIPAHGLTKDRGPLPAPGLLPQMCDDKGAYRLIPTEAFILRHINKMQHSGIIAFVDAFEDDRYFYLVMEHHGTPWLSPDKVEAPCSSPSDLPGLVAAAQPSIPQTMTPSASPTSAEMSPLASSLTPTSTNKLSPPRPAPMERRASCDLFECIERYHRFDENIARYIFMQIVEVVYTLGTLGIVHRDIKDENIVISSDYKVKLIDFGSAVFFDPRQPAPWYNRFFGTTSFASPEILRGEAYQAPASEVWSLGILLSILVMGESPFANVEAIKAGRPARPKVRMSHELRDLLYNCLEPDVTKRPTIAQVRRHPWLAPPPRRTPSNATKA
ncbi:BQ5605_C028g10538 [Microbotryum silenes-dioicae]|uniref:BQ5605_C028g10538 protein n=1 Tax=Microbotryum silenes-dioicae TaxID=796604 RepID=A0A2X0PIX0_9BASI|nr:BQ5605_C028g10538 [Microbotryum silenes-dioicae]